MALNFKDLKTQRKSDFENLQKKIQEDTKGGGYEKDNRYWQPQVDKAGNGYAVIRWLPAPEGEDVAFVRLWSHGFKGPTGQWYIENSRTTLGKSEKDPVSDFNTKLWNETEADDSWQHKQVRDQKRQLSYISNVYVVKDTANPDNEGKVFLFKYGKKIWDKLNGAMYPEFEDEKGMNPFDLWEGADFKLKIRKVDGYRNYDKSEFDTSAPLSEDDDKLEAIWRSAHKLQPLVALDQFKSYDELAKKLAAVLGTTAGRGKTAEELSESTPSQQYKPRERSAPAKEIPTASDDDATTRSSNQSEDDELAFFESLAQ